MSLRMALPLVAVIVSVSVGQAEVITIDTDTVYDEIEGDYSSPQFISVGGNTPTADRWDV